MNSIEITNAINAEGFEEPTAAELAEAKAKHWIELGVRTAVYEALLFIKSDLIDVEDVELTHGSSFETTNATEAVKETIRILESEGHLEFLIRRAWAKRKESK